MATIESRNGKYRVRWNEGGRGGRWRSRTLPTLAAARKLKTQVEVAIGIEGTWETPGPREVVDLDVIFATFITDCARRLSARTVVRYGQHLDQFTRFLLGDGNRRLDVRELTRANLGDFHTWVLEPDTGRYVHRLGVAPAARDRPAVHRPSGQPGAASGVVGPPARW